MAGGLRRRVDLATGDDHRRLTSDGTREEIYLVRPTSCPIPATDGLGATTDHAPSGAVPGVYIQTLTPRQEGALAGASESAAFSVSCDQTNNPPTEQLDGVVSLDIGLSPTFPRVCAMHSFALASDTGS